MKADLYVDGVQIHDRSRLYDGPEVVMWRWRPEAFVRRISLRLKLDDGSVHEFEVSATG